MMRPLLLLIVVLGSCSLAEADWPQFRGPGADGHTAETGLPLTWSTTEHITWKQDLPGLAWSSPVIAHGKIFLTTAVEKAEGFALSALCVDEAQGNVLWSQELFEHPLKVEMHKKNSHASPTPVIDGDRVFVHFGSHGTACLSTSGEVIWKQILEYHPQHGNGGSPALIGNMLVICCDGRDVQYVVGLDKTTGEVRWKKERGTTPAKGFSFCTPLALEVKGKVQAICPGSDAVIAYNPADGEELWRLNYPGGYSVIPRPIYGSGLIFVCTGYDKPKLLAIDPTGQGDVTATHLKWETDKSVPHSASLLFHDGLLYMVSDKGIASCLDAVTGDQKWQERIGGNFSASPLLAEGRVYFQDENGTTTVVAAGPEFKELAKNKLTDERTYASYAIDKGAIFLRSESGLYRIEE